MFKIITKEEARIKGLKKYFTGKICKNGHIDYKSVSNSTCWSCKKERDKKKRTILKEEKINLLKDTLKTLNIDRNIITKKEAIQLGLKEYFTGAPCNKGHYEGFSVFTESCKVCTNYNARKRRNSPRKPKLSEKELRLRKIKSTKKWRKENVEKIKAYSKKYNQEHRKERTFLENKRHAIKLKALPKWTSLEVIKEIYLGRPDGKHVDHIHPLQGKLICGLHVPENLQYLTAKDNAQKQNKFIPYVKIKETEEVKEIEEIYHLTNIYNFVNLDLAEEL